MRIEVDLPEMAVDRLNAEADHRGLSIDVLIAKLAMELPAVRIGPRRRPAFVAVGASETGITDRIADTLADGFGRD